MRLIDADNVLARLPDDLPYKASVRRVLMQTENVDAVSVVFCKDCTLRKDPERCPAAGWKFALEPYDFCSYGEQKGGA